MAKNLPTIEEMVEAGVHFGHRTRQWNPKMAKNIFGKREGIHILNLEITLKQLETAVDYLDKQKANDPTLIFVGTKRQAVPVVKVAADLCGAHYITDRWPGGLITNFDNIHKAIDHYNEIIATIADEKAFNSFPAKKRFELTKEKERLDKIFGGLTKLHNRPDILIVIDPKREKTAILEAKKNKAVIIGIVDSNTDPGIVTYPIAANDDALKSIELILTTLATAFKKSNKAKAE